MYTGSTVFIRSTAHGLTGLDRMRGKYRVRGSEAIPARCSCDRHAAKCKLLTERRIRLKPPAAGLVKGTTETCRCTRGCRTQTGSNRFRELC
jgi:hypothetical protein